MHLVVDSRGRAVHVVDRRRVVIQPRRAAFEQRADDDDAVPPRRIGQGPARGTGNWLRVVEPAVVLGLARVRAGEQLGQADDIRPGSRRFANPVERGGHVFVLRGGSAHLEQGKFDFALVGLACGIGAHGGFPGAKKTQTAATVRAF